MTFSQQRQRDLTQKVLHYKLENKMSYAEFCELVDITDKQLVKMQIGDYDNIPDDVVIRVERVVYE
jgi:hypothetical protein